MVKIGINLQWKNYPDYYEELRKRKMNRWSFRWFRTNCKLKWKESVCKTHVYCHIKMPEEYRKVLESNQDQKSMTVRYLCI